MHEDIKDKIMFLFLSGNIYLQLQVDNFTIVHSLESKKFKSVESFRLSCMVPEINIFLFHF